MDCVKYDNNSLIEDIKVGKLIQILKDIKLLKDTFPNLEVAAKSQYTDIKISKKLRYENSAELELTYAENNWIIVSHNFPESSQLKIGSSVKLKNAAESFVLTINNLQNYFEALYILDLNCIILDKGINWRLIKYSKFAFVKVEFADPLDINSFHLTFYGKDHIIKELIATYNDNSSTDFDDETDIYQKLCIKLKILEFPNKTENLDECSICLCQLNELNQSPIVCCENPKCDQLFHVTCLKQHLNINSYKVLNVAIGECLFCKQKISSNFAGLIKQDNGMETGKQEDEELIKSLDMSVNISQVINST